MVPLLSDARQPFSTSNESAVGLVRLEEAVEFASMSAQVFGSQPWRIRPADCGLELYLSSDFRHRAIDPDGRESRIAAGAALYFMRIALRAEGFDILVEHRSSPSRGPDALISLQNGATPSAKELALFALLKAETGEASPPSQDALAPLFSRMGALVEGQDARLHRVESSALRQMTLSMLQPGDRLTHGTHEDRTAFQRWLGIATEASDDGSEIATWTVQADDLECLNPTESGLDLGVICTHHEDERGWYQSGAALALCHLAARAVGVNLSVFNQPLRVPGVRARFVRETGFTSFPQIVLKFSALKRGFPNTSPLDGDD